MSIDNEARALLRETLTPKRRARTRIADVLRDAEKVDVTVPGGASVAAWRVGDGPAVLCVHGWQDDHSLWAPLMQALIDLGVAVVAFDLPGHGYSPDALCTPPAAADAIRAVAAALGPIDAVVAHSFGGPATGFALADGLSVRRLVLIGAPRGRNRRWFATAEENGVSPDVTRRARELYAEDVGAERAAFDLAALAPGVETLIVHSMDDDAVDWEDAKAVADAWPKAEFVLCDGLGHRMIAQDRAIIQRVVDFVA